MEWRIWMTWPTIFCIRRYLNISLKKYDIVTDNPTIMIYVNKIEYRITFKIKTGYYLEHLQQWNYLEALKIK